MVTPPPGASANQIAVGWLKAMNADRWDEPYTAWTVRVRPYVTASLAAQYAKTAKGHDTQSRRTFVKNQCTSTVRHTTSVQPGEAPQKLTARWVQLTGRLSTQCTSGDPVDPQLLEATVQVVRTPAGWRVSRRLN